MELFHIELHTVRAIKARDICQKYNSPDTYNNSEQEIVLDMQQKWKGKVFACGKWHEAVKKSVRQEHDDGCYL